MNNLERAAILQTVNRGEGSTRAFYRKAGGATSILECSAGTHHQHKDISY